MLFQSLFTPKSKTAYKLPHGGYVDPLRCYRQLLKGGISHLLDTHEKGDESGETEALICDLIRATFAVKPLDGVSGAGYTDEDCLTLYVDFMSHLEKKGLREQTTQTTVAATVPPQPPQVNNASSCT